MTKTKEIETLIEKVPDAMRRQVVGFLRALVVARDVPAAKRGNGNKTGAVARRSFGMIRADKTTVAEVLAEDLYGVE
ncbi:MAG: hypothetical protein FJ388_13980 [Verrucomicrobia bacterium]|nr:hypothetical protein [Verrucomicrobiota bacterium]